MIPVGIDIAKDRYDLYIHPEGGADPIHQKFTGPDAARNTVAMISDHVPHPAEAIIGMEYTGGMALRLLELLEHEPRYHIHIMQDTDVAALRTVLGIRRKTDKLDAQLIMRAMILARDPNSQDIVSRYLTPWERLAEPLRARLLIRHVHALISAQRSAKLRLQRAESDIQRQHHQATIAFHQQQIDEARHTIITTSTGPQSDLLQTLPGISPYRAAAILAAIGDIHRFETPDKLVRYLGLVPPHRPTSGGDKQVKAAQTPRASTILATELFMWSLTIAANPHRYDGFAHSYDRAKQRRDAAGKKGRSPQWTAQRKLIRTIWHILTTQQPYQPERSYPRGVAPIPMPKPTRKPKDAAVAIAAE